MIPVRDCGLKVLSEQLRRQPLSTAKIQFAWRISVGPSMARATTITLKSNGTLSVHASSEHWRQEIINSAKVIRERLTELLGRKVVTRVTVKERG